MENKLYIKVKCSICRGQKPLSCVYCDTLGETYIQASDKTIMRISKAIIPDYEIESFFKEEPDDDV
tara:strand:+ start:304 stop:501 length:198 start_codon:yes stop_codon:yes gene_type:complete